MWIANFENMYVYRTIPGYSNRMRLDEILFYPDHAKIQCVCLRVSIFTIYCNSIGKRDKAMTRILNQYFDIYIFLLMLHIQTDIDTIKSIKTD